MKYSAFFYKTLSKKEAFRGLEGRQAGVSASQREQERSGLLRGNNFYPDFILWILEDEKQYLTFIDPKGIRNLKGLDDPKIQLFKYLQTEVADQIGNPNLVMNSFIVSNTPMEQVEFWATEHLAAEEFTKNHVLFMDDKGYVEKMVGMIG